MNMICTEQSGVGNEAIDSEHKTLTSLVNNVKRAIEARDSSILFGAFCLLETWLKVHFEHEEKKAQADNMDFSNRKLEQQYELNGLVFLKDGLAAKNGSWSDDEAKLDIQFLSDWLIEHITNMDLQKCQFQTGSDG